MKLNKAKNQIPHLSTINNLKSKEYFTIQNDDYSMKKALTKYREKNNTIINNNKIYQPNLFTNDFSEILPKRHKIIKNSSFKLDKNLLEPRAKVKEFYKIQPKILDSFFS